MLTSRVIKITQSKNVDMLDYTVVLLERSPRRAEPDRELFRHTLAIPKAATIKQVSDLLTTFEKKMK